MTRNVASGKDCVFDLENEAFLEGLQVTALEDGYLAFVLCLILQMIIDDTSHNTTQSARRECFCFSRFEGFSFQFWNRFWGCRC